MGFNDVTRLASKMTVARMLERDDFSKRFFGEEQPISLHEFLYPLMQGYDSVMVRADVEVGGNDQRFNLVVGRNLQRDAGQEAQVALTLPLLVGTDGTMKMSKSYGNHVGITDAPAAIYGKVMSVPDEAMRSYFDLATDVPVGEMEELLAEAPMVTKMALARAIVERYHGPAAAREAADRFDREVRRKETPDDIPEAHVAPELLKDGKIWIARLVLHCGLSKGTGEARRLVMQGGVALDGETLTEPSADVEIRSGMLLRVGKRKFARIVLEAGDRRQES